MTYNSNFHFYIFHSRRQSNGIRHPHRRPLGNHLPHHCLLRPHSPLLLLISIIPRSLSAQCSPRPGRVVVVVPAGVG